MRRVWVTLIFASLFLAVAVPAEAGITTWGASGPLPGQFRQPDGIAHSDNGSVYVTELMGNRVQRFDETGGLIASFGSSGTGAGQFQSPSGIAVTPGGSTVYVGDDSGRLQSFGANGGSPAIVATGLGDITGIALRSNGNIYVADATDCNVKELDTGGTVLHSYGSCVGGEFGQRGTNQYLGLAVSPTDGTVFVGDSANYRVVELNPDLTSVIRTIGGPGTGDGQFGTGVAFLSVATGPTGVLYATDGLPDCRVEKLSADGTFLGQAPGFAGSCGTFLTVAAAAGDVVWATNFANTDTVSRIDTVPVASVAPQLGSPGFALTGQPVTLSAAGSYFAFSPPSDFAFDLDGNGSYETDTGTNPLAQTTFATAGLHTVGVRVVSADGHNSTAQTTVTVAPAPPAGPVGVSIDGGKKWTNDPEAHIAVVWPAGSLNMTFSNDGGFRTASTFPVAATQKWRLAETGSERLPKTVYVRFDSSTQTFQDDIILDQTAPKISTASATAASSARGAVTAKRRSVRVKVKARDNASGVGSEQITANRRKPGKWKRYRKVTKVRIGGKKLFVRVRDRAGNPSRWRTIRVRR